MGKNTFENFLTQWHDIIKNADTSKLSAILDEEVVFFSPVVHTPQKGKNIATMYLLGASHVLKDGFEYTRQAIDGLFGVLEFKCMIDDISVEGVDMIQINEKGKIVSFKVMIRPLKAVHKIHEKMGIMLEKMKEYKGNET